MSKHKYEKEYLMIREEIMHYYDLIQNLRNMLYISLAAILTFAISSDYDPLLCLLPYCVILPIYIVTIDYQYGMWSMGTYLLVFLEGEQFNWETRLHILNTSLNEKMERHASSYHYPFVVTGLSCTILFFLKIDYHEMNYRIIIEIIFAIILTISFLIYIKIQKTPDEIKSVYIHEWKNIKDNKNFISGKQTNE